jgi:uncharacterized protein
VSKLNVLNPKKERPEFKGLCALGIMTKAPEPGKVKTRLCPPLTAVEAADLNICFLRDLSESIKTATESAPAKGVGVYTPRGSESLYDGVIPHVFYLLPQRGIHFGERLICAAEDLLQVGFDSVCLINSDSPMVSASNFSEAALELGKPGDRMVLGPAEDGGYYLIGLKKMYPRLFEDIDWSTKRVFQQTMKRARQLGLAVHVLSRGLDVDDRESLQRLRRELASSRVGDDVARHTRKFLAKHV